ncbi:MAG: hypothetical protein ACREYE_04485 [Gammaproteobacteria bacterium]
MNSALCSSSSFINKKATTTCRGGEDRSPSAQAQRPLIFPEPLTQNEQRLAEMYLHGVTPDLHQALLDELADKLSRQAKTSRPVRNAIGLLSWMCHEAKAGRPPLTSAHLQARERRDRAHHVAQTARSSKTPLDRNGLGKSKPDVNHIPCLWSHPTREWRSSAPTDGSATTPAKQRCLAGYGSAIAPVGVFLASGGSATTPVWGFLVSAGSASTPAKERRLVGDGSVLLGVGAVVAVPPPLRRSATGRVMALP